uniref:Sarcosine oxidase subunit delta n=1 Tax=Heterorhabditis bacteriophora TaxID=37862 RepID=A0A1I7WYA5_HETBA
MIIQLCGCGDPMFPIPIKPGIEACHATDMQERDWRPTTRSHIPQLVGHPDQPKLWTALQETSCFYF